MTVETARTILIIARGYTESARALPLHVVADLELISASETLPIDARREADDLLALEWLS